MEIHTQMIPDTWSLTLDELTGIPIVTVHGELTYADIRQFMSSIPDIPTYRDSSKRLWDLRHVAGLPTTNTVRSVAASVRSETTTPRIAAFVVDQDVHFGLARMFEMLSEQPGVTRRVFRDYVEARHWLTQPEATAEAAWGYTRYVGAFS